MSKSVNVEHDALLFTRTPLPFKFRQVGGAMTALISEIEFAGKPLSSACRLIKSSSRAI